MYAVDMEFIVGIAMVCMFFAGRQSVRNRLVMVQNDSGHVLKFEYDRETKVLTVESVHPTE